MSDNTKPQMPPAVTERQAHKQFKDRSLINEIYNDIQEIKSEDRGRISEAIFKEHFLPFFRGQIPMEETERYVTEWKSIAGDLQNPVAVVDNNDRRKELFEVPPFFNRNVLNPVRTDKTPSISDILFMAEQQSQLSPVLGQDFLDQNLQQKALEIRSKEPGIQALEDKWVSIFERYPDTTAKKDNTSTNTSSDKFSDDDFEF